ncbi:MAG: glycosyltransferase, partial [Chitinophagaceae bacterium]
IIPSTGMIKFYNHLPAYELQKEMEKAEYIIGRCGYSSIMDIVAMQKKNILIPTPGQTEQEYLANYLFQKKIVFSVSQKNFSLLKTLDEATRFTYQFPGITNGKKFDEVISKLITTIPVR